MSVAEDDTGHHNNNHQSRSYGSRNTPQEYRDNHLINKQIPRGTRRQSPLALVPTVAHPNSSTQNSNDVPIVVERISDDAASQNNHNPNSTTIPPSSNESHLVFSKDTTNTTTTITASPSADATMRASHAVEAVKVPSAIPATTTTTIALGTTTLSGPPSPTMSNPHETETTRKDTSSLSPVPSNGSTNATTAAADDNAEDTPVQSKSKTHTPLAQAQTQTQTRPKVTTPASPPPSPPSAAGTVGTTVTVTVTGGNGIMVESPLALLSAATVRSNSANSVRGSLASIMHSTHREVDVPESASTRAGTGGGEAHGTPLSPTSMSHGGTHSRKDSAATMASASTTTGTAGTGTEMDMSLKGGASVGEPMDIDPSPTTTPPLPQQQQQQPRSGSGAGSASHTPTGLRNKTAPLPYLPSRSPQPQPQHTSSVAMPSSLGPPHHHHHHRPQPSPSPIPSSHPPPSKSSYLHSSAAAPAPSHLQRRSSHHSHSRSYSGRTTGSGTNPGTGTAPPQPHSTPRQLSPSSQLRSLVRSELPIGAAGAGAGGSDERERERESWGYFNTSASEYDEIRRQLAQFASHDDELRAQRDRLARLVDRLEENERYRTQVVRGVSEWLKSGETLLRGLADTAGGASTFNGRGYGHGHSMEATVERDYERERDRALLSSAIVGGAHRQQQYLDREKTLSVVMPPYSGPHGRPGSGYGPGQDSYSYRHSATPTHPESASHLSRGAGHATRPTHHSTGSNSLRRSRRPSSDDLAEHGGKRIKGNNGASIRTSPDSADRVSHSVHHPGPLSASSIGHTLGRTSALGVGRDGTGEFTSYPTSHNRGSGSLGSGTEHGRESPHNRRTMHGREEDEEEFPSPRRPHAAPPGAHPVTGNGLASAPAAGRPTQARMAALIAAGDDIDAIGSPDIDTAPHETLMEMVEEEDGDSLIRRGVLRHVRGSVLRNGSRSSMNSQDIDDMIAEVADDRGGGNGVVRSSSSAKPRYRGPGSSTNPHPGGVLSTFPVYIGQHHEAMSPGLTRSYTPSQATPTKFNPTSSASPAPQQNNSRGFVFRNTDVADMEAQAQARSPEELAHRPSLSGSGSFNGAQTSPPGTSGNPVTTQFLPPQSGPPQPKKIYHSKGTGQVIGSQHTSSMERVATMPVETVVQPRPLPSSNSLTIDGLPKRTCKQCGQPGRYKDNKCVEKWGPGPQGPGTVCDRCRKKMKRVEKRATQDSAAMNAAINHHQYPIAPAPSGGSFGPPPNQGSQRLDESQEYGLSQATEDGQAQPSLSRAPSQNHIPQSSQAHLSRRGSHAPDQSMHRDATLPYPPNPARETMPPPTSFSYGSPKPSRSSRREPSVDLRDGDLDADGDAEMDELVDDELAAAAEASGGNRRRDQAVKPEA